MSAEMYSLRPSGVLIISAWACTGTIGSLST